MAAEPVLVLGHTGRLGRALMAAGPGRCRGPEGGRGSFDLARPESVERAVLASGCPLVVNCAGYTDVDGAEAEPERAFALNAAGAGAVARACARAGAFMVYLSTDFVFDGRGGRPYRESDPPAPLSAYGRSKLEGERLVREALPGALIVRSAWLFGPGRPGFVEKVLARARAGEPFAVVSDQVGSPTYSLDLAGMLLALADKRVSGLIHAVNWGRASRLELARRALSLAGMEPELARPIKSAELAGGAARPAFSVLDIGRLARVSGGPPPSWLDALGRYLAGEEKEQT